MFTRIEAAYRNRTAVVIGAGGIGAAILKLLAGTVGQLVVADRDESLLTQLQAEFGSQRFHIHPLDVRDPAAVARLFTELDQTFGAPDYLFYTAGILNIEPFAEMSPELWNRAIEINLSGAFYTVQEAAKRMQQQQRGSILILSSIAGIKARSGSRVNPVYNTTKAALMMFSKTLAMEVVGDNIRVNTVNPGLVLTPDWIKTAKLLAGDNWQAHLDKVAEDAGGMKRFASPEEIANLFVFLSSDKASYATGSTYFIDGGWLKTV